MADVAIPVKSLKMFSDNGRIQSMMKESGGFE
jgi:hypothetical protein